MAAAFELPLPNVVESPTHRILASDTPSRILASARRHLSSWLAGAAAAAVQQPLVWFHTTVCVFSGVVEQIGRPHREWASVNWARAGNTRKMKQAISENRS